MKYSRVAFLVFAPKNQRRKDNSFDGNDNIGAQVIAETLTTAGVPVGYVTPQSAALDADLVLVSLTSTHDVYAFLLAVARLPSWQPGRRRFRVFAGGFGMQNPTAIRSYIDYAAFGRAHEWVVDVVKRLSQGAEPDHPSVMSLPDMGAVEIYQGGLYPGEIGDFHEEFTGCPLKCKFCHYTFARKHQGSDASYSKADTPYVQTLYQSSSPEVTWPQLLKWEKKAGRVRVAIDGFSERLRYLYGKRISNADIVEGVNRMGSFSADTATTLMVYNIVNFPGETEGDYAEFVETIRKCSPRGRVIVVVQSTPFRPSLATPMQWEPATLWPDWSKRRARVIVERENLRVIHSFTLETPWTHFQSVLAERAQPEDDAAIHAVLFSPALKKRNAADALRLFSKNFELTRWTAELPITSVPPAPWLHSYIQPHLISRIAVKMRAAREAWAEETEQEVG